MKGNTIDVMNSRSAKKVTLKTYLNGNKIWQNNAKSSTIRSSSRPGGRGGRAGIENQVLKSRPTTRTANSRMEPSQKVLDESVPDLSQLQARGGLRTQGASVRPMRMAQKNAMYHGMQQPDLTSAFSFKDQSREQI
jgi:hypothetical protein